MTASLALRDLAAYSVQVAALVAAAALVGRLLALRPPSAALAYWQSLLLLCLSLPLLQPWNEAARAPQPRPSAEEASITAIGVADPRLSPRASPLVARMLLWALGLGVAARGAWLALGLWTLRKLRRRGRALGEELELLRHAQERIGVRAEFFVSDETPVPVTFGLRRPAILLPAACLEMEPQAQRAILYHELLHVRRRDWAFTVPEEGVRALFWFHPAVAWLIGRIHLSREQVVDRAVVELTQSRDEYVGALLAVARATARPELLPAPLFLRRSRLKQRVAEVLQEGTMSTKRLISSLAVSGIAVVMAAGAAVRLLPLEARADGAPAQVVRGGEGLLYRAPLQYPPRARERGIEGELLLEITLGEDGLVQDARVLSGPAELRAAALQSVLQWHWGPPAPMPGTQQVAIQFRLADAAEPAKHEEGDDRASLERTRRQIVELQKALEDHQIANVQREHYQRLLQERKAELKLNAELLARRRQSENRLVDEERWRADHDKAAAELEVLQQKLMTASLTSQDEQRGKREIDNLKELMAKLRAEGEQQPLEGRLSAIHLARLTTETQRALLAQLEVSVGDLLDAAGVERVRAVVARFDEHLRVVVSRSPGGGLVLLIVGP